MRKRTVVWVLLSLLLFLSGCILALIENGSELSLLICISGATLFLCQQALAWLGGMPAKSLPRQTRRTSWQIFGLMLLAFSLAAAGFAFRFFLQRSAFLITTGFALALTLTATTLFLFHVHRIKRD